MPPIGEETSHVAPSPTGSDLIGGETAAPVSDSPSPPQTPSPPPPAPALVELPQEAEDEPFSRELHPFVPFAPFPGNPTDCLPLNTNLPQVLRQISEKEDLNEVYQLKLRVMAREMSLQRLCSQVPNLRELTLDGSCLISLRDLGCGLVHLEVLHVARCSLDSLDGLFGLMSLKELHAAGNRIDDVSPCTALPSIQLIDLRANNVSDISYVSFLSICSTLEHLVLAECPASKVKGYREEVKRFLPNLITLDGEPIHEAEGDDDSDLDSDETEDDDFGGGGLDDWLNGDESIDGGSSFTDHDAAGGLGGQEKQLGLKSVPAKKAREVIPVPADGDGSNADRARQRPVSCAAAFLQRDANSPMKPKKAVRCLSARSASGGANTSLGPSFSCEEDAPSKLTCGPPLCGNLAASLRRNSRPSSGTPVKTKKQPTRLLER